ncbi:MAG: LacI family transcriptional regulator [Thalassobius sp.]|nr:LacI family transcriptional regulator [Thalassovita sp.]
MKHITIKDIARELNVSVSTVSRAMNDTFDISAKTRDKVLKTAKEMGYHPNPVAKRLHQQKTFQVGVVIPEFINDFFPQIIMGMQNVLQAEGYQLLIMQSNECFETEMENVLKLEENMVDGLLISLSRETQNIDYYNKLYEKGMPMVFFNRVNEMIKAPKVIFNDFKWSYFAVEHLIKQGCKNIIHLAGYKHLSLSRERIRGYEKAMNKFHLPYDDDCIIETGFMIDEGEIVMKRLLDKGICPDGIFATNDPTAIGAIKALKSAGKRIPEDVCIIGFSEAMWSEVVDPPLSSVSQPTNLIGYHAAHLLLEQLNEKQTEDNTIKLDGKLVVRTSSQRG